MEEKKINRNIIFSVVAVLLLVVVVAGATYAYFSATASTAQQTIKTAEIDVAFVDGEILRATNVIPIQPSEISAKATELPFTLTNNGQKATTTTISLTELTIDGELKDSYFKWRLLENDVAISEGDFIGVSGERLIDTLTIPADGVERDYKLLVWLQDNNENQNHMQNKSLSARVTVESIIKQDLYEEEGVNAPELADGMIPVVYNETTDTWVKADLKSEWYNYSNKKWANAVTVTEETRNKYISAGAGTNILMDDINGMWVWIPRYKYKISENIGSSSAVTSPGQIDVIFEEGITTTGVDESKYRAEITAEGTNANYYTHPAFRDGSIAYDETAYDAGGWNYELTGIWFSKFEASTSTTACYDALTGNTNYKDGGNVELCLDVDPIIKPDVKNVRFQSVSTEFLTSLKFSGGNLLDNGLVSYEGSSMYGLDGTTVSHMAKSTEWGAVAYLAYSQYGLGNKEIYINNSGYKTEETYGYYTGRSGGNVGGSTPINGTYTNQTSTLLYTPGGFYSYNDYLINYGETNYDINVNTKVAGKGTGASTSGTIYGVYDMSGGAWDYTMGNYGGYTGKTNYKDNSGFNGIYSDGTSKTDGVPMPEDKFYDHYKALSTNGIITKDLAILGDATWEGMNWYQDFATDGIEEKFDGEYPFIVHGGKVYHDVRTGLFGTNGNTGGAYTHNSFRVVLIP
ncbi:MAG: hypothetical protein E7166_01850 [Firmicutes bacterium]|nr:hypothetical protein [Bacillota bacterium]